MFKKIFIVFVLFFSFVSIGFTDDTEIYLGESNNLDTLSSDYYSNDGDPSMDYSDADIVNPSGEISTQDGTVQSDYDKDGYNKETGLNRDGYDKSSASIKDGIIPTNNTAIKNVDGKEGLTGILGYIKDTIFSLLMLISVGVFLYVGFKLVMARGNAEEFKKAMQTFVYAIVGIAFVSLAYVMVKFVAGLDF